MLLAIDIGNTNISVGLFDAEKLEARWRLATDIARTADEYAVILRDLIESDRLHLGDVKNAAICSSVPPAVGVFTDICQRYIGITPLVVGAGTKSGIRILYDDPRQVGPDRVVDAVAALELYGGPVIVVDFGTATVFDAVSADGDYLGGAIAPGIGISTDALYKHASLLSPVELVTPPHAIGRNTTHSMQSGIVFGYIGLVEALLARIQEELGAKATVVATGGLASAIASQIKTIDVINPDLTLLGLRLIFDLNRTAQSGSRHVR